MATEAIVDDEPTTINGLTLRPSVRKRWVEALRSGEYKQTTATLRNEDGSGYCCLGVLCDLAKDELQVEWKGESFDGTHGLPTPEVERWAGCPEYGGLNFSPPGLNETIAGLNDTGDYSFNDIADLIEGTHQ